MKKIISIVLVVILVFSLCGCMSSEEKTVRDDTERALEFYESFYEQSKELIVDKSSIKYFNKSKEELHDDDIKGYSKITFSITFKENGKTIESDAIEVTKSQIDSWLKSSYE